MSEATEPAQRLGAAVDAARLNMGLSKLDLAKVARVGRSTVTDLVNHGKAPARGATRGRIEAALGWEPGSFAAVLDGAEPTLRCDATHPLSGPTQVLVEQLAQIAGEAHAQAAVADGLAKRLRALGELAESAAELAARTHRLR